MRFLLDTNCCVFLLNRSRPALARRVLGVPPFELGVSTITVAELDFGAAKSRRPDATRASLGVLLESLLVVPFDVPAVESYGPLRADLERRGTPIGPLDTLIAAHALSLGATLVTNNLREFRRVRGLRVVDWTR